MGAEPQIKWTSGELEDALGQQSDLNASRMLQKLALQQKLRNR